MLLNTSIKEIAQSFIGQQEKPGNMGFVEAEFEERMIATGFQLGQSWCAYFSELVWRLAYARYNSVIGYEVEKLWACLLLLHLRLQPYL